MKYERGTSSSTDPRSITSLDYCPKQYKKSVCVYVYIQCFLNIMDTTYNLLFNF